MGGRRERRRRGACLPGAAEGKGRGRAAPERSQSTFAMAAATTRRSLLSLLLVVALAACFGAVSGAASRPVWNGGQRQEVPVHHGGAPVATDRRGQREQHRMEHSYGGYDSGYESSDGFLPYVLPALAITGLSLLFPNVVTVNTGRRRRDTGGE